MYCDTPAGSRMRFHRLLMGKVVQTIFRYFKANGSIGKYQHGNIITCVYIYIFIRYLYIVYNNELVELFSVRSSIIYICTQGWASLVKKKKKKNSFFNSFINVIKRYKPPYSTVLCGLVNPIRFQILFVQS